MRLYTSPSLAYPVTVTKLLQTVGAVIERNAPLFAYRYIATNNVYDEDTRENVDREESYYANFESEVEGTLATLGVAVGQVLERRTAVAEIEEPCRHDIQFGGICAECGRDMTEVEGYNSTTMNTDRATLNTAHGSLNLLVSQSEAGRLSEESKRRLLDSRKLSLVVDLDMTVIQACNDPTIGDWQQDPTSPNHEALKDVRKFKLLDKNPNNGRVEWNWYYIKLRPQLEKFLATVSQYYELHIYTMATRTYAENIANIIDPDHKYFADRILSRDENGSMSSKNLGRLFPVDTKMVVIIDDRGDVWSWSPNLLKVKPYEFFVGIGDINGSFLPKRPGIDGAPKLKLLPDAPEEDEASASVANGTVSPVDRLVDMAGNQDEGSMQEKSEEQGRAVSAQIAERPLLQKQKMLEAAEEEAKASPAVEATAELLSEKADKADDAPAELSSPKKYRNNLLQDDDVYLQYLDENLRNIHTAYYEEADKISAGSKGGRVAELKAGSSKKRSIDDLSTIPDAALVMRHMKQNAMRNIHIVFSGIIPLGHPFWSYDLVQWAGSAGATVTENITRRTTHLIASPERRTAKVRQAAKKGDRIAIVGVDWLYACLGLWKKVDEDAYRIHQDMASNGAGGLPGSVESQDHEMLSSSDDEAAQTEDELDVISSQDTEGGAAMSSLDVDTDIEAELEKYAPKDERQDGSPTEAEQPDYWGDLNDELKDELGSDWDDDESDSELSEGVRTPSGAKKRKRDALSGDGDSGDELVNDEGSRLQKRKREALARTTSLTNVASIAAVNGTAANTPVQDPGGAVADTEEEEGDDLEAALAAEMERQSDEEQTQEQDGAG
nr:rna polymerase ii subunit a c-terminal domain phosphatase [Quercus suber]